MLVDLTLFAELIRLEFAAAAAAEEEDKLLTAESNTVETALKLENKHFLNNLFNA
jgi:hypothetical protein